MTMPNDDACERAWAEYEQKVYAVEPDDPARADFQAGFNAAMDDAAELTEIWWFMKGHGILVQIVCKELAAAIREDTDAG